MDGKELILWSVRLGLACYAVFCYRIIQGRRAGTPRKSVASNQDRWWWSLSGLLFGLHFLAAFHFHHQWSHQHAFTHTAQRTGQMLGWEFGYGLYFNYCFLLLWMVELIWWWGFVDSYFRRATWITLSIHGYLLFVIVNGAVVFVAGPTRWISLLVLLLVGILSGSRLLGKTESQPA